MRDPFASAKTSHFHYLRLILQKAQEIYQSTKVLFLISCFQYSETPKDEESIAGSPMLSETSLKKAGEHLRNDSFPKTVLCCKEEATLHKT